MFPTIILTSIDHSARVAALLLITPAMDITHTFRVCGGGPGDVATNWRAIFERLMIWQGFVV